MDSKVSNQTIFTELVKPITEGFLEGINDTIIMYGPTGSGKTYTMLGDERIRKNLNEITEHELFLNNKPGILLYALDYIFKHIQYNMFLNVSYIEVYNDNAYDLLQEKIELTVSEQESGKFVLKGVKEHIVKSVNEVIEVIRKGEKNRHYAENVMNRNSSRSHTIFQVKLTKVNGEKSFKSEMVIIYIN